MTSSRARQPHIQRRWHGACCSRRLPPTYHAEADHIRHLGHRAAVARDDTAQISYNKGMTDESATIDATELAGPQGGSERAYLVVTLPDRTRVIELPDGAEVSFGRSRGATIVLEHEKVSRMHARIFRRGAEILVEDLDSRNGTRVNGARIAGTVRVGGGDEIGVGPATAVVAVTTLLRRRARVGSTSDLEERLAAEVDRAVRYHRPLGLLMLRFEGPVDAAEAALDRVAATLRRMDALAEYAPDELAVVVPEADRVATEAAARPVPTQGPTRGAGVGGVSSAGPPSAAS